MNEHDHGGVDHQAVGERVGVLAELGLDVPAAGEPAVDLIGDSGDTEDDARRPVVPAVGARVQDDERGDRAGTARP